jgi:hypothetical protein
MYKSNEKAKILVMDFEETEARNDCAGEDQQQLTDRPTGEWLAALRRGGSKC